MSIAFLSAVTLALVTQPSTFRDVSDQVGLELSNGPACWVDVDNDGWTDLVSGPVWRNEHGKRFSKIADVGNVVAADFDNDGFVDLFSYSQMSLYRNVGGKSFEKVAMPELPPTSSLGACWADFDNDGFADLYVGGFEFGTGRQAYPNFVLMNEKGRTFRLANVHDKFNTRGVTACDFDRNGTVDVYVSNYRLQPNQLWLNNGKGEFTDGASSHGVVATSEGFDGGHSIGACWGDFDNDGEIDLFAGNFAHVDYRGDQPKSRFLRNLGPKEQFRFEDKGTCGVFYQESYASPATGDFDNDGDLDLYFTTVYAPASFGKPNYPVLFRNDGGFQFSDQTAPAGLAQRKPTYQAAWADFNNDGHLDLVTDGRLFANTGKDGSWLAVRIWGDGKRVNRSAIGAQIRIRDGKATHTRQVEAGTGQGNQNDLTLHFGLGNRSGSVDVEVLWPNGKTERFHRIPVNRRVAIGPKTPQPKH